jgi:G patch domain/KOW motif-containing protein
MMVEQDGNHNNNNNNPSSSSAVAVTFQVKKRKLRNDDGDAAAVPSLKEAFSGPSAAAAISLQPPSTAASSSLLVIPAIPDTLKWKKEETSNRQGTTHVDTTTTIKKEAADENVVVSDAEAIRALQAESTMGDPYSHKTTRTTAKPVIELTTSSGSYFHNLNNTTTTTDGGLEEDEPSYRRDLERLPPALEQTSDAYERIPVTEFGAALLRGMGWNDDSNNHYNTAPSSSSSQLPRPHRLGLGAIPAMAKTNMDDEDDDENTHNNHRRRIQRPEEYEKQQKLKQQNEMYRQERERQIQRDKQRVLQNGSLVWIIRRGDNASNDESLSRRQQRAEILQLVGVPGLNRVQIRCERDREPTIIQRREIDRLVTRQELETMPFQYPTSPSSITSSTPQPQDTDAKNIPMKENRTTTTSSRSSHQQREIRTTDDSKKKRKHRDRDRGDGNTQERSLPVTWLIPNIRVRVITERFGRRYYKEKGIVTDVTLKGATLQMHDRNSNHPNTSAVVVLQHVPERYLETALPKVGGHAVILTGPHKYAKGTLLERDSKRGTGVLQMFEDMNVLTLSLDDMAEWCGPLDDTL